MLILIKILHSSSDNKSAFLLYNGGILTTGHECMRDWVFREGKSAIILIVVHQNAFIAIQIKPINPKKNLSFRNIF